MGQKATPYRDSDTPFRHAGGMRALGFTDTFHFVLLAPDTKQQTELACNTGPGDEVDLVLRKGTGRDGEIIRPATFEVKPDEHRPGENRVRVTITESPRELGGGTGWGEEGDEAVAWWEGPGRQLGAFGIRVVPESQVPIERPAEGRGDAVVPSRIEAKKSELKDWLADGEKLVADL